MICRSPVVRAIAVLAVLVGPSITIGRADPVSYSREVAPLLDRSCVACHQPGKLKGKLDLSTFGTLMVGGKHGPCVIAGDVAQSLLLTQVKGPKPEMPPEGDPLTLAEVGLLERWIAEGAKDDPTSTTIAPRLPPRYVAQPVITSLAWSPDDQTLAVAGNGEVFWFSVTNFTRRARLQGAGVRVESIQYSPDGKTLAVAGGTPSRFGELQWWDSASGLLIRSLQFGRDSLLSVSWSPDSSRVAVGGADKMVRVFTVAEGRELFHFDQHSDWVFGACFTLDGRSVISASRDRTMKLIDAADGRMLDEICRPNEPLIGVVRHPTENLVANLGAEARVRVFKAQAKPDNHDPNADPNFVREYEHFDGGLTAATYSSDGKWLALAGAPAGEVRVHHGSTSARQARLKGHEGLVFGLAFSPDGKRLATAGFEGLVRIFAWEKERLEAIFAPVNPESDFATGNQSAKNPH